MRKAALVCCMLLCACAYQVQRVGDDHFLAHPIDWQPGTTTVRDVVEAIGPPDVIRWSVGRLLFVYRSERQVVSSLSVSFYLKLFSKQQGRHEDGTLLMAFDDADVLLYYGMSEQPRDDLAGDLGLR